MAVTIEIPDFDFASFFYADILEALIQFKRQNVPELTDESEFEPFVQLLRAFALVGHLNNVNVDVVANESTLPTAQLVEQVRNMLQLIDYQLAPATPGQVDIVYRLAKVFTAATEVVSDRAQAATIAEGAENPSIPFEADEALTVSATNAFTVALGEDGGVFTDFTTEANSAVTPGDDWAPWASPAVGDSVYFCHDTAMWDDLSFTGFTTPMSGIVGRWEYRDGNFQKSQPDTVTQVAATLEFIIDGYVGGTNQQGLTIRVQHNPTGTFEDVPVVWTGSQNKVTTTLLGQSSPSTEPNDYTIGAEWEPFDDLVDGTTNLTVAGEITFTLPQTQLRNWTRTAIEGTTGHWMRFRITEVTAPVSPVIQRARLDQGSQYVIRLATQGESQSDIPLGSSNGLPSQRFTTSQPNFIIGSDVARVDGVEWTRVENFLSSRATDEHYVIELGEDDTADMVFGDGVLGKIPPVGVNNIEADYRFGAQNNGLVGPLSVTVDKAGLTFIEELYNPRQGNGWAEAQGASQGSLERAKVLGPTSLRTRGIGVAATDLIPLTQSFTDVNGAAPYSRAAVFEEGFGPKTVELVVVAKGGGLASQAQLDTLSLEFNGDKFAAPPIPSKFVANQQVVAVNYQQNVIDITATVTAPDDVLPEEVENALRNVVQPEAIKEDGVTFEWDFGGEVPRSRLIHEIFDTDEAITKVVLSQPAADVALTNRQLPVAGNIIINIVSP